MNRANGATDANPTTAATKRPPSPFDPPMGLKCRAGVVGDADWRVIRTLREKGASNREIFVLFGVKGPTVSSRANREGWATPHLVRKARIEVLSGRRDNPEGGKGTGKAGLVYATLLEMRREELCAEVHRGVLNALRRFFAEGTESRTSARGMTPKRRSGRWGRSCRC